MSAIDFDMTVERLPDPKRERVTIGMSGKFLPFKLRRHRRRPGVWV
jgi:cyanate lyase